MAEKIILIGNPIAGGGAAFKIKKASDFLITRGYDVKLMFTGRKGDAEAFAAGAAGQPVRLVIAAGGDGTYNEVANGLIRSGIPMAILPLGTTSVLARELHIPLSLKKALAVALNGTIQTVNLGKITFAGDDSLSDHAACVTRHFLLMAGIGFDAETTQGVNERIKKFTGKGAYFLSGIKTLLHYSPGPITLSIRQDPEDSASARNVTGYSAIIGKASCYGGTFKATPDASLTEPFFYVFVTHKKNRKSLFRYIIGVITGKHITFKDISYFKASEIIVHGQSPVQIDGDYEGTTPAKLEVERDVLRLVTPTDVQR
ncbi:MAG TPA: diacylglycerol kinase family protein [Dissulfurispiraceae bacterium]|nr:diacylglycerol kinase family protein [Dissulfurispiraceae bacterium]